MDDNSRYTGPQESTDHLAEIGGPPDRLAFQNLGGAVIDAQAVETYLRTTFNIPDKNIRTLYDGAATRQGIIKAFRDLRDDSLIDKGDPIVIFYAGHGGELTTPETWGYNVKPKIECLIPHDCEAVDTEPIHGQEPIPDRTLCALLEDIAETKGNNITVIFDCCHSGSGTRDLDEEFVPRRGSTRSLVIRDTLDADIWETRVGETPSGFIDEEIAYEYRGRGRFTIALPKALKDCTVKNELTHVTYADLLRRVHITGRVMQNPRCEGFNRFRLLFNGRVFADREIYYPVGLKCGRYVINAGLAHGVSRGVRFTLYDDKRRAGLVTVLVDEASTIEDFKTTVKASVHHTDASFARMSGVGQLPLYVAPGNHSSALNLLRLADGYGDDAQIFRLAEAKLEFTAENGLMAFKVLEEWAQRLGLAVLPCTATERSLAPVLRCAARYYWFLDFVKERNQNDLANEVAVDLYRLKIVYNEYGEGHFEPAEPGFCKKDPNLNSFEVIDFVIDPDAHYGIKITNQTQLDLYLNVFMFNNGSFSIVPYYTQSTTDKVEAPLKRGGTFTIGYETETPHVSRSEPGGIGPESGEDGYRWAWSDTCCIDKTTSAVLSQSLISMYTWYEEAEETIVYLADVLSSAELGALKNSRWMTRAWTLQELLASKVVRFYTRDWKPYLGDQCTNHKESPAIKQELAQAMVVMPTTIKSFRPEDLGVREKLRLASTRNATRVEDIAYSLVGIFSSDIVPRYGLGKAALGHLLENIVAHTGDVTVISWTGKPSRYNSALPDSLAVYSQTIDCPPPMDANELDICVEWLRTQLSRESVLAFRAQIVRLPRATFSDRCLRLPCILFPVTHISIHDLDRHSQSIRVLYRLKVSSLENVEFWTAQVVPRTARNLVLIHPWLCDIIDPLERHVLDNAGPSDSARVDSHTLALRMMCRLGRPFNALLLEQQSDGRHKRIASDCEIVIPDVPHQTNPGDVQVTVLEIV